MKNKQDRLSCTERACGKKKIHQAGTGNRPALMDLQYVQRRHKLTMRKGRSGWFI